MKKKIKTNKRQACRVILLAMTAAMLSFGAVRAEYTIETGASLNLGVAGGDFAPFYQRANRHGKITQSRNAQIDIWASDSLDLNKKFDFAWGVEAVGGIANKADYPRWDAESHEFVSNRQGPAPIWLQQLYGEVKWRSLYLSVGLKDRNSFFVDQELSSGDLLWSGNSRGIPEVGIGFVDWQPVPLTKQWVEVNASLSYGKFMDTDWINNHFDYWTGKRNPGGFWTTKMLALRTNPVHPFMFQIGLRMTGIFGGKTFYYSDGQLMRTENNYGGFKDFIEMLIPFWSSSREGYRTGDTKGTWDIAARYRFEGGEVLKAYTQWFFEDSSGMWKQNGFDGLWGLEFKTGRRWWISGAAIEYLDLTHMSGPLGYDPKFPMSDNGLPYKVDGRDSYYNNYYYRSYVNYGLNMGTPMVQGILFDRVNDAEHPNNGSIPYFRVRGVHLAVEGALGNNCDYIVKYNHRKAWGDTNSYALIHPAQSDSFMIGASYRLPRIQGLTVSGSFAIDHGNLPGNTAGAMVTLTYERPVVFGK